MSASDSVRPSGNVTSTAAPEPARSLAYGTRWMTKRSRQGRAADADHEPPARGFQRQAQVPSAASARRSGAKPMLTVWAAGRM